MALSDVYSLVPDTSELLTIIITDKFPITDENDPQLPCNSNTFSPLSRYIVVSLNGNVDGVNYLDCLAEINSHNNVFEYRANLTQNSLNVDINDELYSHVCGIGM